MTLRLVTQFLSMLFILTIEFVIWIFITSIIHNLTYVIIQWYAFKSQQNPLYVVNCCWDVLIDVENAAAALVHIYYYWELSNVGLSDPWPQRVWKMLGQCWTV